MNFVNFNLDFRLVELETSRHLRLESGRTRSADWSSYQFKSFLMFVLLVAFNSSLPFKYSNPPIIGTGIHHGNQSATTSSRER